MQPYFAPYIGYFQLINDVDTFIFYDDVNFIKKGWIHRNYITINKKLQRFSIPLKHSSQNKKINEIEINWECKDMLKLIKTLQQNVKNKYVLNTILDTKPVTIADMAIMSVQLYCEQLGIDTVLKRSSELDFVKQDDRVLNLVSICKLENANCYVNAAGGQSLYTKDQFSEHGIDLFFIKGLYSPSILDTTNLEDVKQKLNDYTLI